MNYKIANRKPEALWVNDNLLTDRIDNTYYRLEFIESDISDKDIPQKLLKDILKSPLHDFGSFSLTKEIQYVKEGIPYIRSSDFKEFFIEEENIYFITDEVNNILSKSEVFEGDILITKMGSDMGKAAYMSKLPSESIKCNSNATIAKVRVKDEFDKYYIVTYLNSKYSVNNVWRNAVGSVQPRVNLSDIENYNIPIPSPEIQKYIGDKVRKAEELSEEAKRLKKETEAILNEELNLKYLDLSKTKNKNKFDWVNNEILTDRLDSDYYKEEFIITINHLKKSLKKYKTLKDIVQEMYTGKKPIEFYAGTEVYFVQSGNISSNFLELSDKVKVDIEKYNPIQDRDLLMAKDGETIGKLAINYTGKNIILNEHTYCLKLKEEYKNYGAYIYYLLINININSLIRREATGSAQKGLNQQFLESIIIPIVSDEIISRFCELEEKRCDCIYKSKNLISEAKQDIEDLIEGNFDVSKIKETN